MSTNAQAATAPTSIRHYQITGRLGEGGFGQVYEAWDSKLCRKVALKRLRPGDHPHSASLVQEARLAAALAHPAFVKVYAIEEDEDGASMVMELVHGQTLREVLRDGPLEPARAVAIVAQVAEAMQEAHDRGLVHGDLKPSNLMLEPSGSVRILDFGLARESDADATTSVGASDPMGTIAYMAPERLAGGVGDKHSDLYALGVVFYEMLTGARPFPQLQGLGLAAALVQSNSAEWFYPATLPPQWKRLVLDMTARTPARRLAQMHDVLAACGHTPQAIPKRRPRWLLGLGLAVMLGIGAWAAIPTQLVVLQQYSTASHMEQGLEALRYYDRPGNVELALKHFEAVLEHDQNHAAAVAGTAIAYSRRYRSDSQDEVWLQRATAGAQHALQLNPHLALAHAAAAIAFEHSGNYQAALVAASRARKLDPDNVFAMLCETSTLIKMRRFDAALLLAEAGLKAHPNERSFADLQGKVRFSEGDYVAAEKAFRLSLRIQPDAVYAYANLNGALQRQGRMDEALQVLQQGLQIRPNAWLYGNLGNALFQRGDYVAAVAAFESAVAPGKGNPGDYLGWANLADTLLWIPGRQKEARSAYQKALDLLTPQLQRAPNDETMASRMGLYQARTGDHVGASKHIEHALRLAPTSLEVRFRAGLAYEIGGNRDKALAHIQKALALGYPARTISSEPDLAALRRDPRYPQH